VPRTGRRRLVRLLAASFAIAAAAVVPLVAEARDAASPSGTALERLSRPPFYSSLASQRIYFVMPDRYANGDPANDRGGKTGERQVTGYDPADAGWFHGGDLEGLTGGCTGSKDGLQRVKELGFTAIWVTPVVRQQAVQGSSAAYHGYWGLDFTDVDPHLGTSDDFKAFTDCAHRLGLKVILDVVVNHTADAILVGPGFVGPDERPYRDCHGKPFVAARYAGARGFPCLSAANMPRQALLIGPDRNAKRPAWLNDVTAYHDRGDIDFSSCSAVCFEQGDFFGLDDLFTEQPRVVNGLAQVYGEWIRRYGVDGFRVDTAKHVDRAFFGTWLPKIRAAARSAGVEGFQVFGEVFETDAVELSRYVRDRGIPNVIDFPLQDALTRYAGGFAGAQGIAARFSDDDYFRGSSGLAPTPATFLGNHDIGRGARAIATQAFGASDARLEQRVLLGTSLLYLLRGAPVVMYGDEVGMMGGGGDKAARQDMFPTKVSDWQTEKRVGSPPIGTGSSFDVKGNPIGDLLRTLGELRNEHPALSTGSTIVRRAGSAALVVSRFDRRARREYVEAFNSSGSKVHVTVTTSTPDASWEPLLGATEPARTGADGRLTLTILPLQALLYRAGADLPARPLPAPVVRTGLDLYSELFRINAAVRTLDPVSVTFALSRGGGPWRRVAVDDGPPFRAFLEPSRFRKGEKIELVSVARGSNGSVAVSSVVVATPHH
jgi:glycosidase